MCSCSINIAKTDYYFQWGVLITVRALLLCHNKCIVSYTPYKQNIWKWKICHCIITIIIYYFIHIIKPMLIFFNIHSKKWWVIINPTLGQKGTKLFNGICIGWFTTQRLGSSPFDPMHFKVNEWIGNSSWLIQQSNILSIVIF